jgi:hypothetical protein
MVELQPVEIKMGRYGGSNGHENMSAMSNESNVLRLRIENL